MKNKNNYCIDCGRNITKYSKRCRSCSSKGILNYMFGKSRTEEIKRRISKKNKGKKAWNKGLKGLPSWNKGLKFSEESKKRMSIAQKKRYKTTSVWNKGKKRPKFTKKWLENLKISHIGKKHTEEEKKKISIGNTGENHWNWRGGTAVEPYTIGWNKTYKKEIRKRDNYTCQLCGKIETENIKAFPVHHINYDKKYLEIKNNITLCLSCHNKTNNTFNRNYWKNILEKKIKLIYKE